MLWFTWQGQKESNPRHAVLETAALPAELYPYFFLTSLMGRDARCVFGTPDAIRTHDLQSRSLTLYPTELRAHKRNNSFIIAYRIRKSKEKSWRHKAILLLERNTQNRRVPEKLKNPHEKGKKWEFPTFLKKIWIFFKKRC